jgi:hypothetical protein
MEYTRLSAAAAKDARAAHLATRFGGLGIMGRDYASCGYASLEAMIGALKCGPQSNLDVFSRCSYVLGTGVFLKRKDWVSFANRHRGAEWAGTDYPGRLKATYDRLVLAGWNQEETDADTSLDVKSITQTTTNNSIPIIVALCVVASVLLVAVVVAAIKLRRRQNLGAQYSEVEVELM